MPQNITSFYKVAQTRDFARQFQFRLVDFMNTGFEEDDLVYVQTASLPGRTVNNVQVPYMGLQFNVPGTAQYPGSAGYAVTFRCDQNYDLRSVLEQATFDTFNDNTSTGNYNTPSDGSVITLHLLNKDLSAIVGYQLIGAYITSLGDSQYDISDNGAIQTIDATIAYQFWRRTIKPLNV
jgi:hypothetical protein